MERPRTGRQLLGAQIDKSRTGMRRWLLPGAAVLVVSLAAAIWYLHHPLSTLKVTGYTQITHDGHQKILAGTDGSRLYFNQLSGADRSGRNIGRRNCTGPSSVSRPVSGGRFAGRSQLSHCYGKRIMESSDPGRLHSPPCRCRLRSLFTRRKLGSLRYGIGRHLPRAQRWDASSETGLCRRLRPRHRLVA